jgi:hypothetical protein
MSEKFTGESSDHGVVLSLRATPQVSELVKLLGQDGDAISALGCGVHDIHYADMSDRGRMIRQAFGPGDDKPTVFKVCPSCLRKSIMMLGDMKMHAEEFLATIEREGS